MQRAKRGVLKTETCHKTHDENYGPLNHRHRGATKHPPEDDRKPWNRRDKRFLEKPELPVPDDFDS